LPNCAKRRKANHHLRCGQLLAIRSLGLLFFPTLRFVRTQGWN
jgi:hypothetical protein